MANNGNNGGATPAVNRPGIVGRPRFFCMPSLKLFTAPAPTKILIKIHDKWYDLTEFERHHPGGPISLNLARDRDATNMFESHHRFADCRVLDAIIKEHEVADCDAQQLQSLEQKHGIEEYKYNWETSDFGEDVKFQVKINFTGEAKRRNVSIREAIKATPERWLEIGILAIIWCCTFRRFFGGDWRRLEVLAFGPTDVLDRGAHVFHDATHFALSTNWRINAVLTYMFPITSPFTWYLQHIVGHHSYVNVGHRDPDVLHHYWWKREF